MQLSVMQRYRRGMVLGVLSKAALQRGVQLCTSPDSQILARAKSVVQRPHSQTTSAQPLMTPSTCVNVCPAACALQSGTSCRVHIA